MAKGGENSDGAEKPLVYEKWLVETGTGSHVVSIPKNLPMRTKRVIARIYGLIKLWVPGEGIKVSGPISEGEGENPKDR